MPSYKVTAPGFYDGITYSPTGKRRVLHVDKPFSAKTLPSWVKPIKAESAAARKKREAAQTAANEKAESDQKDIKEASFLGTGENAPGDKVETL